MKEQPMDAVDEVIQRIHDRRNQPNPPGTVEALQAELDNAPRSVREAIRRGDEALAEEVYQ